MVQIIRNNTFLFFDDFDDFISHMVQIILDRFDDEGNSTGLYIPHGSDNTG